MKDTFFQDFLTNLRENASEFLKNVQEMFLASKCII